MSGHRSQASTVKNLQDAVSRRLIGVPCASICLTYKPILRFCLPNAFDPASNWCLPLQSETFPPAFVH
jgi:hypothetical protein